MFYKFLRYGILYLILNITGIPAFAQTRGVGSLENIKENVSVIYENSYALIVGIDEYQDKKINSLEYAIADAEAIAEMIQNFGFNKENIIILKNEQATRTNFIKTFTEISEKTKENDRLLIYWAGHGVSERIAQGEEGYLVPFDTDLKGLAYSGIPMSLLSNLSRRPFAKHQLFLIDACYGGLTANKRSLNQDKSTIFSLQVMTKAKAIQVITAGGRDQEVVESAKWGHSAFTYALLRAVGKKLADFNKDGLIASNELYTFLKEDVTNLSRSEGVPHTPVTSRFDNAEGEFVFFENDFFNQDYGTSTNTNYTGLPEWYLNPPYDNEDSLYVSRSSKDYRDAFLLSLNDLMTKITVEYGVTIQIPDSNDVSFNDTLNTEELASISQKTESKKEVTNQSLGDLSIESLTKSLLEETVVDSDTSYKSTKVTLMEMEKEWKNPIGNYMLKYFSEEDNNADGSSFNDYVVEEAFNYRFSDVESYVSEFDFLTLQKEQREIEGETQHFIMFKLSKRDYSRYLIRRNRIEELYEESDSFKNPNPKRDSLLYIKFMDSAALEEQKSDSTKND